MSIVSEGNRFALFGGYAPDTAGGWRDWRGSYSTPMSCKMHFNDNRTTFGWDWGHIVDTHRAEVVAVFRPGGWADK
jgi:hypothetical protein